jgi:hypothetical protein
MTASKVGHRPLNFTVQRRPPTTGSGRTVFPLKATPCLPYRTLLARVVAFKWEFSPHASTRWLMYGEQALGRSQEEQAHIKPHVERYRKTNREQT